MPEICIFVIMVIFVIIMLFLIGVMCHEISYWFNNSW